MVRRRHRPWVGRLLARGLVATAVLAAPALVPLPAGAATLVVTTGADSGPGSLRAVVESAVAGDTVTFGAGVSEVGLDTSVALDGGITIDGGGTVTIRLTDPTCADCPVLGWLADAPIGTITLRGLTVTGGTGGGVNVGDNPLVVTGSTITNNQSDEPGGGLATFGALTVEQSAITNNVGTQAGGGLAGRESLTLTDTTVSGNVVEVAPGEVGVFGGGAATGGALVATRVEVTDNVASAEGVLGFAFGGGLATVSFGTSSMVITDSAITGNSATVEGLVAIADGAGAFSNWNLEVSGSVVASNTSTATGPSFASGRSGGLASRGSMTVTDTRVEDNEAIATGEDANTLAGGLWGYGPTQITDSAVVRNTSRATGGGAAASAGALYVSDPGTVVTRTELAENVVEAIGSGGRAWGGAIGTQEALLVVDSDISRNSVSGSGSGIVIGGGGLLSFAEDPLVLRGSTVSNNTVSGDSETSPAQGGGVFAGRLLVEDSTISGNSAGSEGGGVSALEATLVNSTISGNSSGSDGGALHGPEESTGFDLTFVTVAGNNTGGGSTISIEAPLRTRGSAIEGTCDVEDGVPVSEGGNVTTDESCADTEAGDVVVDDLGLQELGDNGGPAPTRLPTVDSPLIGAVVDGCPPPSTDQRGEPRSAGSPCDAGAVQLQLPGVPTIDAAIPGDGEVTLTFIGPQEASLSVVTAAAGRSAVIGYEVSSDDGQSWSAAPQTGEGSITVSGLRNGTTYTFRIRAVSADGPGGASSSVAAMPVEGGRPVAPRFTG